MMIGRGDHSHSNTSYAIRFTKTGQVGNRNGEHIKSNTYNSQTVLQEPNNQ